MIPQDARSPHQQQRWIDVRNESTTEDIPAFSIVEIVSTTRPEQSCPTENSGRTVFTVKKPTAAGMCNFLLIGHKKIPKGGTVTQEQIGTNDYPAYVKYSGSTPNVGEQWGTTKDAYTIQRGVPGLYVVGDADSDTSLVRVMRNRGLHRVALNACHEPGDTSSTVTVQKWDGSAWGDTGTTSATFKDPLSMVFALKDDVLVAECIDMDHFQPVAEYGLRRRLRVTDASVACAASGNGTIRIPSSGCVTADSNPACSVSFCNRTGKKLLQEDIVDVEWNRSVGEFVATSFHHAQLLEVTLDNDVCTTGSHDVTYVQDVDGCLTRTTPTTATNPKLLLGESGDTAWIRWDDTDCAWYIDDIVRKKVCMINDVGSTDDCIWKGGVEVSVHHCGVSDSCVVEYYVDCTTGTGSGTSACVTGYSSIVASCCG